MKNGTNCGSSRRVVWWNCSLGQTWGRRPKVCPWEQFHCTILIRLDPQLCRVLWENHMPCHVAPPASCANHLSPHKARLWNTFPSWPYHLRQLYIRHTTPPRIGLWPIVKVFHLEQLMERLRLLLSEFCGIYISQSCLFLSMSVIFHP